MRQRYNIKKQLNKTQIIIVVKKKRQYNITK